MRNKNCPYCRHKLNLFELLRLDEHAPRKCKNCGNFLKTSLAGSIVSVVIPVVLCAASLYLIDINFIFAASLLLLIPLLRIALAEPMPYNLNSNTRKCSRCGQTNVRFKNSFAKICDNCLLSEQKHAAGQISEPREREADRTRPR
jgi:hypothetical protein